MVRRTDLQYGEAPKGIGAGLRVEVGHELLDPAPKLS